MNDARMTIRLPAAELDFAKLYAKRHGMTLTGLIQHYLRHLERFEKDDTPSEVEAIAGLLPTKLNVRDEYHSDMLRKHS